MPQSRVKSLAGRASRAFFATIYWLLGITALLAMIGFSGAGAETVFNNLKVTSSRGSGICGNATALSSCKVDRNKDLEVGGAGCGPSVYVDELKTRDFNTITIDSGATLCFPDQTATLTADTILVNGLLCSGLLALTAAKASATSCHHAIPVDSCVLG